MATIITTQETWSAGDKAVNIETRDGIVCVMPRVRPPKARTFPTIEDAREWLTDQGYEKS